MTFSDLIDAGLRRKKRPALPVAGRAQRDEAGRFVRFTLRVEHGWVVDAVFEASHCVTLIAFCELAARQVTGRTVAEAVRNISVINLASAWEEVPAEKRRRAVVAVQALLMALAAVRLEECA